MGTSSREILVFLFVTVLLGGFAAAASGRAVALTWRPLWQLAVFVGLLVIAVRLLAAALFGAALLCASCVALDVVVLSIPAGLAHRIARARQMRVQYPWAHGAQATDAAQNDS